MIQADSLAIQLPSKHVNLIQQRKMFINGAACRDYYFYGDCFLALEFTTSDYDSVLSQNTCVMVASLTICSTRALCVYQCKLLWISNKTL